MTRRRNQIVFRRVQKLISVDNTKPTINIDIKDKATLNKQLVIIEGDVAKDANGIDSVVVTLDGKDVELPGDFS